MNSTNHTEICSNHVSPGNIYPIYFELSTSFSLLLVAVTTIIIGSYASVSKPRNARDPRTDKDTNPNYDPSDMDNCRFYITSKDDLLVDDQVSVTSVVLMPIVGGIVLVGLYYALKNYDVNYYLKIYLWIAAPLSVYKSTVSILTMVSRRFTHWWGRNSSLFFSRYRLCVVPDEDDFPLGRLEHIETQVDRSKFNEYIEKEQLVILEPTPVPSNPDAVNFIFDMKFVASFVVISVVMGLHYHFPNNWIIGNILGVSFVISTLSQIKLNQFKLVYLLLSGLFFYDIYFVFGTDIMETVATGLEVPMKLLMPRIGSQFSLLGLGDVVVPGFLISLCLRFDIYQYHARNDVSFHHLNNYAQPYFKTGLVSYVLGLLFTFSMLHIFQVGQPALLYIVPCLLIGVTGLSLFRQEFTAFWSFSEDISEFVDEKDVDNNDEGDEEEEEEDDDDEDYQVKEEGDNVEANLDKDVYDDDDGSNDGEYSNNDSEKDDEEEDATYFEESDSDDEIESEEEDEMADDEIESPYQLRLLQSEKNKPLEELLVPEEDRPKSFIDELIAESEPETEEKPHT